MVTIAKELPRLDDHDIDVEKWLNRINDGKPVNNLVREAAFLSRLTGEDQLTPHQTNCFEESLYIAEIIAQLKMGHDAIAAALLFNAVEYTELTLEDINEQLGRDVAALIVNTQAIQSITNVEHATTHKQIDNIRKMLLAMVRDVRAVIIKLAERACVMRAVHTSTDLEQQRIAHETMAVYAPLANRLGINELKWELEDLAYSIIEQDTYKKIAKSLDERRLEREERVERIIKTTEQALKERGIVGQVTGRAKHIYSIHKKMMRKKVDFSEIYDAIAVRILVPEIEHCYQILSFAHENWTPIQKEFDDYISTPKANGYQSIHTAVSDKNGKYFEIQIRTFKMHEESEMGMAAHWVYKEGKTASGYEEKIKWLRQLLDWQKEVTTDKQLPRELEKNVFQDRVYVFTPDGEIIDLPNGATPLDFAYHIHTELGHRCRGARVNEKMVQLIYTLKLGDIVEVLTIKQGHPSRDWIIPQRGYLKTARARAKVLSWFKTQELNKHEETGKQIIEKEFGRLNLDIPNYEKIANELHYTHADIMLAALGRGDLKLSQILNLVQEKKPEKPELTEIKPTKKTSTKKQNAVSIYGVGDLLTHMAQCCNPLPGDNIIGYITQGHGVTIHRRDCNNALHLQQESEQRMIEVEWNDAGEQLYQVAIDIDAYDRSGLLSDITQLMLNNKISIHSLTTSTDKKKHFAKIKLTIEISNLDKLSHILEKINQIPNIKSVKRHAETSE